MPSATPPRRPTTDDVASVDRLGFAVALDAADETIAMFRPITTDDGRFVDLEVQFANAAARRRWYRGPLSGIVGRRLFEAVPILRPMLFELYRGVVEDGVPYRGRDVYPTPDGPRTIEVAITPFDGGIVHVGRDVTATAEAMAALEATDRRLRERTAELEALTAELEDARDIAGLGVFRRDLGSGHLTWSPQVYRVFGLDPDGPAPTVEQVHALFTPDSNRRRREANDEAARTGRPWDIELEVVRPDGERRWIIQRGRSGVDAGGHVTGYLGTVIDITDRKRAEEELRAANERLRRYFEAGLFGTFVAELDGRVLEANDYWLRLVGRSREDLDAGRLDWRAVTDPSSAADDERALDELRATGSTAPYEKWYRRPDGTRVPALVVRARVPGPGEQVASVVLDLTERRAAAAGMARLAAAIDQATESVVVTDTDANILYVNPAFERVTGYTAAEAVGRNPRLLQSGLVARDTYGALWATLARGEAWRGELVNRRKDGTLYTEDASISPIRDETGAVTAYVAVKRDITGVRALEAQLRQAQRLEAIGRLAGGVAHDFNNLLTAIRGYGELVLDGLPADAGAHRDVAELLRAADRASALTRQLLAFSRRQEMAPEVLDPASVIEELVPMLRRLLGEHISLVTRHPAGLGHVRVDPVQLEQVIVNLAVNARDAMPDGGHLEIATADATGPDGPVVRITVADSGAGMDEATLARAFEPFFTTKEQGKGTGMGLATVFGIVSQSGGTVDVRSRPGEGTTFLIDLPRIPCGTPAGAPSRPAVVASGPAPDPGPASPPPTAVARDAASGPAATADPTAGREAPLAVAPGARAGTILLVEDQASVRAVAARILRRLGHRVVEAGSGPEAMAIAKGWTDPLDLLLTDVRMPGMQGPELARRLRVERPGLRVLFMSGFAAEAWASGEPPEGTRVLDKPFDADTLGRAVAAALDEPR